MNYCNSVYVNPYMQCSIYGTDFSREAFIQALDLIEEAVQEEQADELRYNDLLIIAPSQDEIDIITSIREDKRNHRRWFREIYKYYTGTEIPEVDGEEFVMPSSYLEGISKAVFGELKTLEKYRFIREGLPSRLHQDTVDRILTDQMKHATKYNNILNLSAFGQDI